MVVNFVNIINIDLKIVFLLSYESIFNLYILLVTKHNIIVTKLKCQKEWKLQYDVSIANEINV